MPAHALLAKWHKATGNHSPNIVWGGLVRAGGSVDNLICLGERPSQTFLNLGGTGNPEDTSIDTEPHACTLPRLEPIELTLDTPGETERGLGKRRAGTQWSLVVAACSDIHSD